MKPIYSKLLLLLTLGLLTTSCFESDSENALEDIGEKVEEVTEDAADEIKDATN